MIELKAQQGESHLLDRISEAMWWVISERESETIGVCHFAQQGATCRAQDNVPRSHAGTPNPRHQHSVTTHHLPLRMPGTESLVDSSVS